MQPLAWGICKARALVGMTCMLACCQLLACAGRGLRVRGSACSEEQQAHDDEGAQHEQQSRQERLQRVRARERCVCVGGGRGVAMPVTEVGQASACACCAPRACAGPCMEQSRAPLQRQGDAPPTSAVCDQQQRAQERWMQQTDGGLRTWCCCSGVNAST